MPLKLNRMKTKRSKQELYLIDGNNFAHRALHAYSRLSHKGQSTSIIFGMPSMVQSIINQHRPDKLIIVWDGQKSKHRRRVCPEYKSHRNNKKLFDHEDFMFQKKAVQEMFYTLGVPQAWNKYQEADDMIHKIVKVAKDKWKNITICSGDKDFHQELEPNRKVSIWNAHLNDEIHWGNCEKYFGYTPDKCVDYLILVGDSSDDIKGYPGIGPKRALEFLKRYNSIEDFLDSRDEHPQIDRYKLMEVKKRNEYLICLNTYYRKHKSELKLKFMREARPIINPRAFKKLAETYNLQRLLSSPRFLKSFQELNEANV